MRKNKWYSGRTRRTKVKRASVYLSGTREYFFTFNPPLTQHNNVSFQQEGRADAMRVCKQAVSINMYPIFPGFLDALLLRRIYLDGCHKKEFTFASRPYIFWDKTLLLLISHLLKIPWTKKFTLQHYNLRRWAGIKGNNGRIFVVRIASYKKGTLTCCLLPGGWKKGV